MFSFYLGYFLFLSFRTFLKKIKIQETKDGIE